MLDAAVSSSSSQPPTRGSGGRHSPSPEPGGCVQPPIWRKPDDEDNVGDIEMWAAAQVIELAKMYLDGAIDLNHE